MERGEYERLAAVEREAWWFRGLHANLIAAWRRAMPQAAEARLLDAGCGTGGLLMRLAGAFPRTRRFGVELDPVAAAMARARSDAAIAVASIAALPFAASSLDAVLSADVLCHSGVEPAAALASITACLRPGGVLVLNLPAYRWLFSGHDRAVNNVRRFGLAEVRTLLAAAGYAGIRAHYWNSLLFPLMVLRRISHRHGGSDVTRLPGLIEPAFRAAIVLECWLGERGLHFPFGGSILATAMKP